MKKSILNVLKSSLATVFIVGLVTGCSKEPFNISGVWIPEHTKADATYYNVYEIKQKDDDSKRYQLHEMSYKIKSSYKGDKVPRLLNERNEKVLELNENKNNTYCVEGSLDLECVVVVDGKLDFYKQGRFVKSDTNPPKIPTNH